MRINTNVSAINAWRQTRINDDQLAKSLERLSSGLRVNRASDDAAGLSISESLRAQVRGSQQAMRNVQDGISAINIADGGLSEIHALLQRGRELAVQAANSTLGIAERDAVQAELDQLSAEIDRISQATTFNGIPLLQGSKYSDADRQLVLDALQNGALKNAYDKVAAGFGMTLAAAPPLDVEFVDSDSFAAAYVSYSTPMFNPASLGLTVVLDWAVPTLQGGDLDSFENVLAHEMVHAVMAEETNMFAFPDWFQEGTAEFIIGADSRLSSALASMGGDISAVAALITTNSTEMSSSNHYAAAYLAVKYLDDQLRAQPGFAGGMADAFNLLDDSANDLNALFAAVPGMGFTDQDDFLATFKADVAAWAATPGNLNLGNTDTGSIMGSDYTATPLNWADVVTTSTTAADPTPWTEVWPTAPEAEVIMQVGANEGQEVQLALSTVTAQNLGVASVDVGTTADAGAAISAFDGAIATVSTVRGALGAQSNQFEHTMNNLAIGAENMQAAESRIRDTDMAATMTAFTRRQVLAQSSQAMLAQANMKSQNLLSLLSS